MVDEVMMDMLSNAGRVVDNRQQSWTGHGEQKGLVHNQGVRFLEPQPMGTYR